MPQPILSRPVIHSWIAVSSSSVSLCHLNNEFVMDSHERLNGKHLRLICLQRSVSGPAKRYADPYIKYSLVKFEGEKLKDYLSGYPDIRLYVNLDFVLEMYDKLMKGSPFILIHLWRAVLLAIWLREEDLIRAGKNSQDQSVIQPDR